MSNYHLSELVNGANTLETLWNSHLQIFLKTHQDVHQRGMGGGKLHVEQSPQHHQQLDEHTHRGCAYDPEDDPVKLRASAVHHLLPSVWETKCQQRKRGSCQSTS